MNHSIVDSRPILATQEILLSTNGKTKYSAMWQNNISYRCSNNTFRTIIFM